MTALIIIGAIFALIGFVLSVFIRISIVYDNEGDDSFVDDSFVIKLNILFFSFPIVPESRRKKVNPRNFTYKKYQKLKEKELKKQKKTLKATSTKKVSEEDKTSVSDLSGMLNTLKSTIGDILKKFSSHLHVDIQRFRITIGGDNAAKTAITYGIAYPAVLGIFEILEKLCILHDRRKSKISVDSDFTSEKINADIKIQFKIRIFHLIGILIPFLLSYVKNTQKSQGE